MEVGKFGLKMRELRREVGEMVCGSGKIRVGNW